MRIALLTNCRTLIFTGIFLAATGLSWAVCVPTPSGLVSWWPGGGNAKDIIGPNDGTLQNGTAFAAGRVGQAFNFDGIDDYVDAGTNADLSITNGAMTLEAWIFPTDAGVVNEIVQKAGGASIFDIDKQGYQLRLDNGGIPSFIVGGATDFDSTYYDPSGPPSPLSLNQWHHLAGVYDGAQLRLFVDGTLVTTKATTVVLANNTSSLKIGTRNDGYNFKGLIDEVSIYSRALSSDEIVAIYQADSAGKCIVCTPHKAKATAVVVGGFVVGSTLTDPGCGYTNAPAVLVQGGGGSGATAYATVSNGLVSSINITSAGSGYSTNPLPQILIASPPFAPSVGIAVSRINVSQHVTLGKTYVLESSNDLNIWSPTGPQFTADNEDYVTEFVVGQVGKFFRLRQTSP